MIAVVTMNDSMNPFFCKVFVLKDDNWSMASLEFKFETIPKKSLPRIIVCIDHHSIAGLKHPGSWATNYHVCTITNSPSSLPLYQVDATSCDTAYCSRARSYDRSNFLFWQGPNNQHFNIINIITTCQQHP